MEYTTVLVDSDISFESYCYEVIIAMGFESIKIEYQEIKSQAIMLLVQFKKSAILDINTQENLRLIKNKIATILSHVNACRSALIELLDDEEVASFRYHYYYYYYYYCYLGHRFYGFDFIEIRT